jgi:hypothetical protein
MMTTDQLYTLDYSMILRHAEIKSIPLERAH